MSWETFLDAAEAASDLFENDNESTHRLARDWAARPPHSAVATRSTPVLDS